MNTALQKYIEAMHDGATITSFNTGSSTWCSLVLKDGGEIPLPDIGQSPHTVWQVPLKAVKWDSKGNATHYVLLPYREFLTRFEEQFKLMKESLSLEDRIALRQLVEVDPSKRF